MNVSQAGKIDGEVPATVFVVPTLPEVGNASTEEHCYIYFCVSDGTFYYGSDNGDWGSYFFNLPIVQSRDDVAQLKDAFAFLPESTATDMYALNPLASFDGEPFVNISDAIIDVDILPTVPDSGKIYRLSEEATYGTLYIKNEDDSLSINTFEGTPVNILIVDTLPEQYKYSSTAEAFIYYQKSDNKLYWRLIENDGWMELSESGIPYQIITSADEILTPGFPYIMVSGDGVKHVEGGLYIWDGEWKTLTTSDILEDELNTKAATMLAADEKRLAAYAGSTRRPFDQSLFDALKNQYRVYVESGNYGGVYPVIALTDTGEGRVFNPWGFNTLEDMFNGQHWPLSWDGNIITEATADNPTGWYKVIRDEDGNAISYHPTLGTIVQRYNDGNIRVPKNPRDGRDAASKAYVDSKSSASTSYTNTKFNEAKAYTDANSFANPNIGTYAFTYKGSNGLGSIPYCSDDSPNSTDASIRANTAVVRTKVGEVMCITNDSSKKQAAVNKQFLEEQLTNQAEVIIDEVNSHVAPEIVTQAAQITANAVVESKTGNELILRDINPNASTISIHTEPNITVRACTPVVYSKDRLPVSNTNAYGSGYADIYPPKHQKYKLSCSFENPNNNNIALVAKLDDSGNGYTASSSATSGELSVIVDLTEKTYVNKIRLRFYSNYSGSVASASDVVFSNIKLELADEIIEKEDISTTTSTQGTTDENGNLILAIPDWSPIIIYNINDYDMEVTYNQDINSKFNRFIPPLEFTSNGDGTCSVTGIGECSGKEQIIIPVVSPLGDYVTSIGMSAFSGCSKLTSITIPDSVTGIGSWAFQDCSALTSVTFGENSRLKSIDDAVFYNCSALTSITIPNSVTSIGYEAFKDCSALTLYCEAANKPFEWHRSWNPDNRPVIWGFANNFITANDVYAKKTDVFAEPEFEYAMTPAYDWEGSEEVVTIVGMGGYANKKDIVIPTKTKDGQWIRKIAASAFQNNTVVESLEIASSIYLYEEFAFSGCTNLTKVTFNTEIDGPKQLFDVDNNIKELYLYNADQILESAFGSLYKLEKFYSVGTQFRMTSTPSMPLLKEAHVADTSLYPLFIDCKYLREVTLSNINTIADTFVGCISLNQIILPKNIESILGGSFRGCNNLTIYCEDNRPPEGRFENWDESWNYSDPNDPNTALPVIWGYEKDLPGINKKLATITIGEWIVSETKRNDGELKYTNAIQLFEEGIYEVFAAVGFNGWYRSNVYLIPFDKYFNDMVFDIGNKGAGLTEIVGCVTASPAWDMDTNKMGMTISANTIKSNVNGVADCHGDEVVLKVRKIRDI
jgi:hypothetical protein